MMLFWFAVFFIEKVVYGIDSNSEIVLNIWTAASFVLLGIKENNDE